MCVTSPQIQDLVELHKFLYVLHVHETHLGDSSTNILKPRGKGMLSDNLFNKVKLVYFQSVAEEVLGFPADGK